MSFWMQVVANTEKTWKDSEAFNAVLKSLYTFSLCALKTEVPQAATGRWQPCAWWGEEGFPHPARTGRLIWTCRCKTATIYHRAKYLLIWEGEALWSGDSKLKRLLYAGDVHFVLWQERLYLLSQDIFQVPLQFACQAFILSQLFSCFQELALQTAVFLHQT